MAKWGVGEAFFIIALGLLGGYFLDVAGAYQWWNKKYRKKLWEFRIEVINAAYPDPSVPAEEGELRKRANKALGTFRAKDPEAYRQVIEEPRAKWVLALEAAVLFKFAVLFWIGICILLLILFFIQIDNGGPSSPSWFFYLLKRLVITNPASFFSKVLLVIVVSLYLGRKLTNRGLGHADETNAAIIAVLKQNKSALSEILREPIATSSFKAP